ncbi:MAG: glycoside hydrolase family 2 [Chloroflexota bacterium]|nr:glycoside hydrolase family 2 [Chloroflexota bacterium]
MTELVRSGENVVVVRCEDEPSGEQPCGKQDRESHRPYMLTATSGIWQTVWLEPVGDAPDAPFLEHCRIVPDLALGGFRLWPGIADIGNSGPGLRLEVQAFLHGRPAGTVEGAAGADGVALVVEGQRVWSPDRPRLYDLRLRLLRGDVAVDEVYAYAGLREVTIRGREVLLNGDPIYQRQVLDQGYWPDGLYTAASDDALRRDVEWTKRLGFNGARKHQKVEDPRWLYWCDRLGLLVWAEMASFRTDTARSRERLRREWREVLRRDANHPSIVAWVPFNESMGLPTLASDPDAQAYVAAVAAETRALDPTRPVVDNSGWSHGDTDIADTHNYEPDAGLFLAAWRAFHEAGRPEHFRVLRSWDGHHQERRWYGAGYRHALFVEGRAYAGQPILVSEWGGFFLEGAGEVAPVLAERRGVEPDEAAFLARYAQMVAAFDSLPDLAGDCWTQLTDVEDEPNGLLTEDRSPKVDAQRIRAINLAAGRVSGAENTL